MKNSELKRIKTLLESTIRIGKNGISLGLINEITNQLKSRGIVKIKVLKNFLEKYDVDLKSLAQEIAKRTNSKVLETRGKTIILFLPYADTYKPKFKEGNR